MRCTCDLKEVDAMRKVVTQEDPTIHDRGETRLADLADIRASGNGVVQRHPLL